ncbi:MAG: copper resistance protein B [Hyphomonadaceae bacterium]|nr:copper resistance protein B [Hyphomonadaceae bacterium]
MHHFYLFLTSLAISAHSFAPSASAQHKNDETPPWSQADEYWDKDAMQKSRMEVQHHHGGMNHWFVMADRLEIQSTDEEALVWDLQGWYGGDINKLWIKSEGEYSFDGDEIEDAEIQALWSRAVSPFWDIQAGVRYDLEPKGRTHGVFGVQGLAPYWFEIDAAAFVSHKGDITARAEVEYEMLLTQTLILQPRLEIEASAQDIEEFGVGSGLTGLDLGIRLRKEIKREFAPYVGVEWQKAFGSTADFLQADGGDPDKIAVVAGIRAWF